LLLGFMIRVGRVCVRDVLSGPDDACLDREFLFISQLRKAAFTAFSVGALALVLSQLEGVRARKR
jgi:hypothetical protein